MQKNEKPSLTCEEVGQYPANLLQNKGNTLLFDNLPHKSGIHKSDIFLDFMSIQMGKITTMMTAIGEGVGYMKSGFME